MAEERDSGQERTEEPTPKRLREAREKGQVPRSRELTMTAVMMVGSGALVLFGAGLSGSLAESFADAFVIKRIQVFDERLLADGARELAGEALGAITPLLAILLLVALVAPALLGGWSFSRQALAFKADRLDPVKGMKRVFGSKGLMELLKAVGKFTVVGAGALIFLWFVFGSVLDLSRMPVQRAISESAFLVALALFVMSSVLILIAAVDVPFQLHSHHKQLRMTRQELRDELKQTEGSPEVRSRLRNLQQQRAGRRMMQEVPKADVVINNPTHFAVALRYDASTMEAPVVIAKGVDRMALAIRRIAGEHRIPQVEAPVLARSLYASVEPGRTIPPKLFAAVAEVLAWVHRVRNSGPGEPVPAPPSPEPEEAAD